MNTSIKYYQTQMFNYGLLTILFILEHFEEQENYEECQKIIIAIKETEKKLDCKLVTKLSNEAIKLVIDTYINIFNLTGKNAVENSKYYSEKIIKELLKT